LATKSRPSKNRPFPPFFAKLRQLVSLLLIFFLVFSIILCGLLRWLPPPTSAFMMYRHYEDLVHEGTFKSIRYRWVNANNISPNASAAVMASEDQRFPEHFGFDIDSIQSSIEDYKDGGKLRGASTISQQVAKNLFLTPAKSFVRKGIEAWFTLLIELLWTKERILEVYLNIAEFGDHLFGIETASQQYFGIPARSISRSQAALLAATLPNPVLLKAARPSAYLLRRQHWILRQMSNLGQPKI
jgi:monofunctional biosynthetic peptidoglycan transglycosylase